MRVLILAIAALASCVSATFGQHDALAAQGLLELSLHVATEGLPEPKTCSLKNVRVRREWYVARTFPKQTAIHDEDHPMLARENIIVADG